jgi:hypothetical protein
MILATDGEEKVLGRSGAETAPTFSHIDSLKMPPLLHAPSTAAFSHRSGAVSAYK